MPQHDTVETRVILERAENLESQTVAIHGNQNVEVVRGPRHTEVSVHPVHSSVAVTHYPTFPI